MRELLLGGLLAGLLAAAIGGLAAVLAHSEPDEVDEVDAGPADSFREAMPDPPPRDDLDHDPIWDTQEAP